MFVSIHCNSIENSSINGTQVYYHPASELGTILAENIYDKMVDMTGLSPKDTQNGSHLYVIRTTISPAVLVETAFIDNKNDSLLLKNGQKAFAEAIRDGILSFLGIKEPDFTEIVKGVMEKAGLEQKTMDYLLEYEYGRELVKKLFDAMK